MLAEEIKIGSNKNMFPKVSFRTHFRLFFLKLSFAWNFYSGMCRVKIKKFI